MNIFILNILFISFLNNVNSLTSNYCVIIKNNYLKLLLLSDKRNIKIFKEFKNLYNNSMLTIVKLIIDYNNLTEDDKILIETITSLCY
jgi:hypothetical protein